MARGPLSAAAGAGAGAARPPAPPTARRPARNGASAARGCLAAGPPRCTLAVPRPARPARAQAWAAGAAAPVAAWAGALAALPSYRETDCLSSGGQTETLGGHRGRPRVGLQASTAHEAAELTQQPDQKIPTPCEGRENRDLSQQNLGLILMEVSSRLRPVLPTRLLFRNEESFA